MAKFRNQKTSFIAGEISPTAMGRTDLPQYLHACKTLQNVIPLKVGGAYRRPGSKYEDTLDASTEYAPCIIPFVVSKKEAYALLFSKTAGSTGYATAYRPSSNTGAIVKSAVSGTLPYLAALSGTLSSVGYYDEWHDVQYVQSVDLLYLVHPGYKPYRVGRTAVDTFSTNVFDTNLTGSTLRDSWPYRNQNTTTTTIAPSATTGSGITLTASAAFFNSGHVGALFKIDHGGTIGCAKVTAYTNSTHVTADVVVNFGATTAVAAWWESSWSDYRGWPRAICFYEGRLCYLGNKAEPDTMWLSQASNYDVLSVGALLVSDGPGDGSTTGPTGSQPFTITLRSQEMNQIQWASPGETLLVGTLGQEFVVERETDTDGFGADNAKARPRTGFGSGYRQAVRGGGELYFCPRSEDEIQALIFNETEQSYVAEPVQLFFDHYPKAELSSYSANRKIRKMAWDQSRSVLWCCDTAGNLFGMTRDRRLEITAWHSHRMGGYSSSVTGGTIGDPAGSTYTVDPIYFACTGSVVSLAVVPNPLIGTDDLWLVVKRKINGSWKYHVERVIGKQLAQDTAYRATSIGSFHYLTDSSVLANNDYPSAEDYQFSSLSHLNAEVLEGTAFNSKGIFAVTGSAVSAGSTTMATPYPGNFTGEQTTVSWGLGYSSIIEPVRIEAGSQVGTSQGAIKRVHEVNVRFHKTLAAKVGADANNLETLIFREASTPLNKSAEIFTGDKLVKLDSDYDRDGYVYLLQDKPLPFAVVSVSAEGLTYD